MKKILILTAILISSICASAQIKDVSGSFLYIASPSESRLDAAAQALRHARIDALAREFGTIVSQDIMQSETVVNDRESTLFFSNNETQVKGEWIADTAEPKYEYAMDSEGNLTVRCTVRGRAKPISNEAVEFAAECLRNGTTRQHADTRFRPGDDFFVHFEAPVDGYVAVFLEDLNGNVFTLLPYIESPTGEAKVKKNYDYIFFDPKRQSTFGKVDALKMTLDGDRELNKVYIIFSPNAFSKPVDHSGGLNMAGDTLPRMQSRREFNDWLIKTRRKDPKMAVKSMNIEITN